MTTTLTRVYEGVDPWRPFEADSAVLEEDGWCLGEVRRKEKTLTVVYRQGGWPELTYRYVMHYFWTPQDLFTTPLSQQQAVKRGETRVAATTRKMRQAEVPLNYLLNTVLALAPPEFRLRCLSPFGLPDHALGEVAFRMPELLDYVQPDVRLESSTSRIYIELKVDAPLTLDQIRKYVRRHRFLNAYSQFTKDAYLLLLVRDDRRGLAIDRKRWIPLDRVAEELPDMLGIALGEIVFRASTWQRLGEHLTSELEQLDSSAPASSTLRTLVVPFVHDLEDRGLLRR